MSKLTKEQKELSIKESAKSETAITRIVNRSSIAYKAGFLFTTLRRFIVIGFLLLAAVTSGFLYLNILFTN